MTESLLQESILLLERSVISLTQLVSPPKRVPFADAFVYRYVEQTPQQAIVQKLARLPSALRGAEALMNLGLFQEQAALQRIIDEVQEDTVFLSLALLNGDSSDLHEEYLNAFYLEENDPLTGAASDTERPMVKRKKIRAYIARAFSSSSDPSGHIKVSRDISKLYSGFVHAASPHIMDIYFGDPPKFHMSGMLGTERESSHRRDLYNYFHRALASGSFGAHALGAVDIGHALYSQVQDLELFMYGRRLAS